MFTGIVRENFDAWCSMQARARPTVYTMLTGHQVIDIVVHNLSNKTLTEVLIGEYAQIVHDRMQQNKFEYRTLPCYFELVNNENVKRFCELLLRTYLTSKEDGTEQV